MGALPANLPDGRNARLPQTYEAAKVALSECVRIDECKNWADKAAALASYAKQAEDQSLMNEAMRIQGRATRRIGELLKEYDARGGDRSKSVSTDTFEASQRAAAEEAGLSKRQQVDAVRVANIPEPDFERAVEAEHPPTKTALADMGRKPREPRPLVDLGGRSEADFRAATDGQGELREFARFVSRADAGAIIRGSKPHELSAMRQHVSACRAWINAFAEAMEV